MTNCPHCGARNGDDREVCEYCSEPIGPETDAPEAAADDRWGAGKRPE